MVQILPPRQSTGNLIGQGLGQGLASGIERGSQIGLQRNMLQNSLKEAESIAQDPNTTPIQRNLALLKAFAGIPGSERYVGQILPLLNQQAAFNQKGGGGQGEGYTSMPNEKGAEKTPPTMVGGKPVPAPTQDIFPQEEVDLYEPFLGKGVKKYSPQEIQAVEYQDLSQGLPNSPRAEFMRKQNAEVEAAVDRISERQASFANYYGSIHPNMSPDDQRVAIKFSRTKDALNAPTNQEKARIVDNFVDRYRALRTNISNQNPRSIIGETREKQESEQRNQIDWLLKEGQRDLAKDYLTNTLHWGDAESERIIKEPSKEQVDLLTKFEKLPELAVKVPEFGKNARSFQTYNKERTEKLNEYDKRLEKAIKPGTAKEPGTSLLVLRDLALETGMTWVEFNDQVNKLVSEGRIKLDPYQKQELPKLSSAPVNGFWDMLLERR